jgi:hypothetical protein
MKWTTISSYKNYHLSTLHEYSPSNPYNHQYADPCSICSEATVIWEALPVSFFWEVRFNFENFNTRLYQHNIVAAP